MSLLKEEIVFWNEAMECVIRGWTRGISIPIQTSSLTALEVFWSDGKDPEMLYKSYVVDRLILDRIPFQADA